MINYKVVVNLLGILLILEGFFIALSAGISFLYGEKEAWIILLSSAITLLFGFLASHYTKKCDKSIRKREGFLITTSAWVVFSIFGGLPFLLTGKISNPTDCFFETMSGFTTTGATILNDIESLGFGLHFWRSLTQWIGGMGIVVLTIALLPYMGVGAVQLFEAEVPGPVAEKIHPQIKETAKRLWGLYLSLTLAEAILLWFGGMTPFDAICHSFTTLSTGGFSTKQASIAHWDSPFIHYVITVFMFFGGINFSLFYYLIKFKLRKVWSNEEFRYYFSLVVVFTLLIGLQLYFFQNYNTEKAFRDSIFQVVSIITTTGYCTADYYGAWLPSAWVLILIIMLIGGSAGSTGGGIKVMRWLLVIKNSIMELRRIIHPNAIVPLRYNRQNVSVSIEKNTHIFIVWYFFFIIVGILILLLLNVNLQTSIGAVLACIGNIGPGIGEVGPVGDFSDIPTIGKWLLSFLMLIGRLEIFTVILLFSRAYWRK